MRIISIRIVRIFFLWIVCFSVCSVFTVLESGDFQSFGRMVLEGTVRDKQGAPLPGVMIELKNIQTEEKMSVLSNENGAYRFKEIKPGEYWVTVELQGYSTQKRKLSVGLGQSMRLDFELPEGEPVFGTAMGVIRINPKNAAGIPTVTIMQENGEVVDAKKGNPIEIGCFDYSFASLHPGAYMVKAEMDGFETEVKRIKIGERQTKKLDFNLKQKRQ